MRRVIGFAAALIVAGSLAGTANATTVMVQAATDFDHWGNTGLTLVAGKTYDFTVNAPTTT
jgi:hypothetical protein